MASTINASNAAAGGLITTADASGVLDLQAANTTIARVSSTGLAVTGTITATGSMAGNGPAFSAYIASNQTVSSATYTKLTFNTKVFDTNTNFDATTNYRFTPTVAGYYQVTLIIQAAANSTGITGAISKNGSAYSYCTSGVGVAGIGGGAIGSALILMNGSTDYLEGYIYTTGGSLIAVGGANNTQFSASLVRSA